MNRIVSVTQNRKDCLLYLYAVHLVLLYLDGFVSFPTILVNITQYLFIALGFIRIFMNRKLCVSPFIKWGGCFLFVMLLSLFYAPNASDGIWLSIIPFTIQFLVYLVLFDIIKDTEDPSWIMHLYVFVGVLFSIVALVFYASDLFSGRRFGFSLGFNPNEIMLQMILPASFAFFFAFKDEKTNIRYLVCFALCSIVSLSTGSKKSVVIMVFAFVFLLLKANRKNKIKTYLIMAVIILLANYALFNVEFLYNALGKRIESLFSLLTNNDISNSTNSDYTRHMMRKDAFALFLNSPIWGNGSEAFRTLSSYGTYSHNNYVEILCSYGIIGGVVYYVLPISYLIKSVYHLIRFKDRNINMCLIVGLLVVYLLIDWGSVTTVLRYNMFLFSFCSTIFLIQRRDDYASS